MSARVLSAGSASAAIAELTLRRILRSRVLWVAAVFALFPLVPFLLGAGQNASAERQWEPLANSVAFMHMLITALFTASAIAEEIEDKTYAYLWSRPIPRGSVLAGKLVAGCAIAFGYSAATLALGANIIGMSDVFTLFEAIIGLGLGTIAVGCGAACIGTLMPKHPLAVSIAYFLVLDFGLGSTPFSGARLSVTHNMRAIAGFGDNGGTILTSSIWLLSIALVWTLVCLWRLARREMSTGS